MFEIHLFLFTYLNILRFNNLILMTYNIIYINYIMIVVIIIDEYWWIVKEILFGINLQKPESDTCALSSQFLSLTHFFRDDFYVKTRLDDCQEGFKTFSSPLQNVIYNSNLQKDGMTWKSWSNRLIRELCNWWSIKGLIIQK